MPHRPHQVSLWSLRRRNELIQRDRYLVGDLGQARLELHKAVPYSKLALSVVGLPSGPWTICSILSSAAFSRASQCDFSFAPRS